MTARQISELLFLARIAVLLHVQSEKYTNSISYKFITCWTSGLNREKLRPSAVQTKHKTTTERLATERAGELNREISDSESGGTEQRD